MDIADSHPLESHFLGCLKAAFRLGTRGAGEVGEIELGMKRKQGVGYGRVALADESGNISDLLLVHISWNHQGAGNEKRRVWSLLNQRAQPLEVG